jgi:hypothetical protein
MNTRIALVLLSALGATAALPSIATATFAAERHDRLEWDADAVLRQLQDKGIAAVSVEEWNGYVRAYVQVDGGQVMQYFDADTLTPVNI